MDGWNVVLPPSRLVRLAEAGRHLSGGQRQMLGIDAP